MGILLSGRYYDSLYFRSELAVCICYGALGLKINHIAYSANNMADAQLAAGIDSKFAVFDYTDPMKVRSRPTYDVNALLIRKKASLIYIDSNCHHHFVKGV